MSQLKNDVEVLKHTGEAFDKRYVEKGPLVKNIKAYDAAYRVEIFTQQFIPIYNKYVAV